MPRTITLSNKRQLSFTGNRDPRGFDILSDSIGNLYTQQGGRTILSRPAVGGGAATTSMQGGTSSAGINEPPIKRFFGVMQDMLKTYQGVRADQLANVAAKTRKFGEEKTGAILQETSEENKRFSPSTQFDIRTAQAQQGAGEANVFATAVEQQDARAQAFNEVYNNMRQTALDLYGDDLKKPKVEVLQNYKSLLESGRINFGDIPDNALPYVMEIVDPNLIPESPEQQLNDLKIKQMQYEISQLGKLTPQEEIDLKQWAYENFPEQADQVYTSLRGNAVSSEKFTPPSRADLGYNSTMYDFFGVYAPKGDGGNDPVTYAKAVARRMGVDPSQPVYDIRNRLDEFAQAIADHEGFTSGASRLARVNNNPGNLRFIGQPGATQGQGGFAAFPTVAAGFEALKNDIRFKLSKPGRAVNTGISLMATQKGGLLSLGPKIDTEEMGKLLTPEEAIKLGVPYGTTRGQAAKQAITPKKPLGDTQITDLTQAQIALNNVKRIGELMDQIHIQGPVVGRFRTKNPYDPAVVELNSLITQTVPGLARGIFKEVGVITNVDIENYTKTLNNPKLTKEQAKRVQQQIEETVNFSIRTQLDTLNKAGKDVSEFEDLMQSSSGGGGLEVRAPNGKTYRFQTIEAANEFRRRLGG